MTLNPIKIIYHVVAAARLDAALKRTNQFRHIASELRRMALVYDKMADEAMAGMKEGGSSA